MNKILLIGNSGLKSHGTDGQTVKVRLYLKKIKDEGFDFEFIDLEDFFKHPFSTLSNIKKGIKKCDRIVLITAERGSKILIPYINRKNKKHKKPFVFPLVGTSVLHYSIDKLNESEKNDFIINHNFSYCRPSKKLIKELQNITTILPETDSLSQLFKDFYMLDNIATLTNFRDISNAIKPMDKSSEQIKTIFVSRVMEEKGIFDLMEAINACNYRSKITLDIYGKICLNKQQMISFNKYTSSSFISYHGSIEQEEVINTIKDYDIFIFPTRFIGEGTPGVIVESLLAGVPVLTSDFPQASQLLKDGYDSIFFKIFDQESLKSKLIEIINNKEMLIQMKKNAFESSKKYTYEHERKKFLKYICGVEE